MAFSVLDATCSPPSSAPAADQGKEPSESSSLRQQRITLPGTWFTRKLRARPRGNREWSSQSVSVAKLLTRQRAVVGSNILRILSFCFLCLACHIPLHQSHAQLTIPKFDQV